MTLIKWIFIIIVVVSLLPVGAITYLHIQEPIVAKRFVGLFTNQDDDYSLLTPRAQVETSSHYNFPEATEDSRTIETHALDAMQAYAQQHNSYALIVLHQGIIQHEWYANDWHRDRAAQSQSMHKSVLPVLVQASIEAGVIKSMNEPVSAYLSEWQDDPRGMITLEQLLAMNSGLRAPPFSLNPFSDDYLWLFGSDMTPILLSTPLENEPGELWDYNNIGSEVIGLVLERAWEKPYAQILSKLLWDPMGASGAAVWLDNDAGKAHSNCCLLAPPMDWAKFGSLLLNNGQIRGQQVISAEAVKQMVTPATSSAWYGLQIWLSDPDGENPWLSLSKGYQRTEPFLSEDTYYTSGFGAQRVYVVPSEQLVIVRMGPATGMAPVREDWDNAFLVNTALRNLQAIAQAEAELADNAAN